MFGLSASCDDWTAGGEEKMEGGGRRGKRPTLSKQSLYPPLWSLSSSSSLFPTLAFTSARREDSLHPPLASRPMRGFSVKRHALSRRELQSNKTHFSISGEINPLPIGLSNIYWDWLGYRFFGGISSTTCITKEPPPIFWPLCVCNLLFSALFLGPRTAIRPPPP